MNIYYISSYNVDLPLFLNFVHMLCLASGHDKLPGIVAHLLFPETSLLDCIHFLWHDSHSFQYISLSMVWHYITVLLKVSVSFSSLVPLIYCSLVRWWPLFILWVKKNDKAPRQKNFGVNDSVATLTSNGDNFAYQDGQVMTWESLCNLNSTLYNPYM